MALLDQWGRPINMAALKQEQAGPTIGSVRQPRTSEYAPGLAPGKLARLMRAATDGDPEGYLALAEEMEERDLHYAGVLSIRKRQVAGLEITVEAAGDDADSVADADLIRAIIARDEFELELVDVLDAIGKGFSATEIMWDTSEGQWMPSALRWRDPTWFRFDRLDGEKLLLREPGGDVELEPYKWIVHTAKIKSGLAIRGGVARAVAWSYLFKSFTAKDWAIFVEAYGQPLRVGKYGNGATEPDKDTLLRAVTNIGADYAAIIPASMSVEFVKADVTGSHELYEKRCDWLDRQVSKLVLGQTQTTDATAGGYATAKVHDGVRADIERADAKQLAATLNRDLVRPLIDLNRGRRKKYPKIRIGRPDEIDIDKLIANVVKLVPYGLRVERSVIADKLSLPDAPPDAEILVAPAAQPQTPPDPAQQQVPAPPLNRRAANRAMPPAQDAIDLSRQQIVDDGWQEMIEPMIAGLEARVAAAGSPEAARQAMVDQFKDMGVDTLAELLARATFAARLAGEGDDPLSDEA